MWTAEQQQAIDARAGNLIVSASAGSGKTAVLVEHVLKKVCDPENPKDIDQFLIVTFTKAASSEIREKISKKLGELLLEQPENTHLQRQLVLVNRAKISTIHSFCLDIIKQNFQRLDLPPFFRIGQESELKLIFEKELAELLEDCYEAEDPDLQLLLDQFSKSRNDEKLSGLLLTVYKKTRAFAGAAQWYETQLRLLKEAAGAPVFETRWGLEVQHDLREQVHYLAVLSKAAMDAAALCSETDGRYGPVLQGELCFFRELEETLPGADYRQTQALLRGFSFARLPPLKKDPAYEDIKAQISQLRKEIKSIFGELCSLCQSSEEEIWAEYEGLYPVIAALFSLTERFGARLTKEKLRRGVCDFADMEHNAFALLVESFDPETGAFQRTELARELAGQYEELLIDEYQDTNQIQDLIFAAVSREEGNLFMVGDVKQSIYRFRLAMPEIFLEKTAAYPLLQAGQTQGKGRVVLPHNFRSGGQVVAFVNFLFRQLMSPDCGGTAYLGQEELLCGFAKEAEAGALPPCLLLADYDKEDEVSKETREAELVAHKILELLRGGDLILDRATGKKRGVQPSDIAILMLYPSRSALIFAAVLREHGIAALCDASREFLTTYEVATALSMLRVIDNPHQDVALIAALKSPMFCFTPDMLAEIRLAGKGSFFTALTRRAQADGACADFLHKLNGYRLLSSTTPVHRLLWKVICDTGLLSSVSAMANGNLRRENLRLLYEYAKEYEATSFRGLFSFNHYITELLERGEDFESADEKSKAACVRIMSVHKSKGLEFPVCFLSGLAQGFNQTDLRAAVLLDHRLGVGAKLRDMRLLADYDTFMRRAVAVREEADMLSELVRVLYVALTRPREILVMTAVTAGLRGQLAAAATVGEMDEVLDAGFLSHGKTFLSWILAACIRHPEARALRAGLPGDLRLLETDCPLQVTIAGEREPREEEPREEPTALAPEQAAAVNPAILALLERNMSGREALPLHEAIPSKVTVTQLVQKRALKSLGAFSVNFLRPEFILERSALNAAERGTALHAFFQYADLFRLETFEDVEAEKERLMDSAFLTEGQLNAVKDEDVLEFCKSRAAAEVRGALSFRREEHFSVMLPASAVMDCQEATPILLQGVMDCVALTERGVLLLDYKTDRVQSLDQLKERYEEQLRLYALAARQIYELPVYRMMLYSTHLHDTLIF